MSTQQQEAKKKALELALSHIEKQFGEGSIMTLGKHSNQRSVSAISTGSIALDLALGVGGLPKGRIVEIYGPESSGKSTLAIHVVANAQKNGGTAAYIDAEHALDPRYASRLGVKLEDLLISQPDCGEDALNIAEMLARSGAVDVIVIDSVAALVPKHELEGEIGDVHVGLQARMMSQALRRLTATLAKSNTCAIFINQIREKVGVMFGNPETTTGGRALKFYSSIRIDIRKIGGIKGADNNEQAIRVKAKVVKNKMAPPFRWAEFSIYFNEGISRYESAIDLGITLNLIEKKGSWLIYKNHRFQGKDQMRLELKSNIPLLEEIEKQIHQKCAEGIEPLSIKEEATEEVFAESGASS